MECVCDKEILAKHGCTSIVRAEDGKMMCNSPCVKRLVAERDEMRKQMLEELGRADLLEKRVIELESRLSGIKKEYVVGRRIDDSNAVYYSAKYETPEEARKSMPPNSKSCFVAERMVTDFKEIDLGKEI